MTETEEMLQLCLSVRAEMAKGQPDRCLAEICRAMSRHPDAPEPHNLLGLLLESQRDHASAMRHFRAAYALDPSYLPARENIMDFGRFDRKPRKCFTPADCN